MRLRPVLPLLLLGLVATGCGGSTESATPESAASAGEVVRAASARVVDDGSSRLAVEVATSTQGLDVTITGEGLVDYATGAAEFTVTLPGSDAELTVRAVSDALFLTGVPGAPADQWVRLDPSALGPESGLGDLGSFTDPASSFDQLQAVADDVTEMGREDVRGTQTTHYRGTVLLADVVEQAPADRRGAVQRQLQVLQDAGVDSLPFDVFVDDDGRLRRMVQTVSLDAAALGGGEPAEPGQQPATPVEVATTIDVFDVGVEVDVQEPPADQVTDGAGLVGGGPGAPVPS